MRKLYVVMYHYVRDLLYSRYPAIRGLDYNFFKQQIAFFNQNFNVVTMEQVLDAVNGGELPEKALLLTFDDGYIDHYTFVLPVLKAYNMQGSFFIPGKTFAEDSLLDVNKIHFILASAKEGELLTELFKQMNYYRGSEYEYISNDELFQKYAVSNRFDTRETIFIKRMLQTVLPEQLRNIITTNMFEKFVRVDEKKFARELYMSREQIWMLKKNGMFIGLHGYKHYWLGCLNAKQMEDDILQALEVMEEFVNLNSWVMNYPYGSHNKSIIKFIQENGCKLGMTTEVQVADLTIKNRFQIPRSEQKINKVRGPL